MANALPAPAIYIDDIAEVSGGKGRGLIKLSSWGTPVVLTLDRNLMMKLGHMAMREAHTLFEDDGAEVLPFPTKKRAKAGRR